MITITPEQLQKLYSYGMTALWVLITLIIGYIIIKIIAKALHKFFDRVDFDPTIEKFIEKSVKFVLWIFLLLFILDNLGVDIGPMLAGLGVAGFIVGFALKDTLGNLASGIMILIYKPFRVGNYVHAGGIKGTVQEVGISACILKTPDNKKITIPNSKIWGQAITNYSAHNTRRIDLTIGISYESDVNKALKIIKDTLKKNKKILNDPEPIVAVTKLADYAVELAVKPWVKRTDYWDVYYDLHKELKLLLEKNKIEIPYPKRVVFNQNLKK